jgi:FkbM family methyltransferase
LEFTGLPADNPLARSRMIGVWKPWFVYRPRQILKRILSDVRTAPAGFTPVDTSWGGRVIVDPTRAIGRSIVTTGLFDLAVSETLVRLIDAGDTVIDAGANVGYMTVLAATAAGRGGRVLAFEPHPELFAVLRQNAAYAGRFGCAVETRQVALGDYRGSASLQIPASFANNDGLATLVDVPSPARSVPVTVERLDDVVDGPVSVMKLDVEGFEASLLRGAHRLVSRHRLRHIVFEEHDLERSDVVRMLRDAGYHLFAIGWQMRGLEIRPIGHGRATTPYEAPSFVATTAPDDVIARTARRGWQVLSARLSRPR